VKAVSGTPTGLLTADGGTGNATQWIWSTSGGHILLESRVNVGKHAMEQNTSVDKIMNSNGGTSTWSQFDWGAAP
jgi:hypothetical protein